MSLGMIVAVPLVGVAALMIWRMMDHHADRREMDRLVALQPRTPAHFDRSMLAGLPEPVQRYFTFSIKDGTPLFTVARIAMEGRFSLGTKDAPNDMPMRALQVLAAPHGFVWKMAGGSGTLRLSGSDSLAWTRFWMGGIIPVAHTGGGPDHARSAFGRCAAEAVFWTPAALLPGPHVTWHAIDGNTAQVTVRQGGLEQVVRLTVAQDGQPISVSFQRWSNANPAKTYRLQPFGGYLSDFRDFDGFRLPTHVEAGNGFGTDDYFAFFVAQVRDVTFPSDHRE